MNLRPHTFWLSCIQPLRLECEILEDGVNHDTPMKDNESNFKPEDETTATSLEESAALSNMGGEEMLPPSQLCPHGSNIIRGERSSL